MLFNKNKKRMIDVRELQKRGVVRLPKKEISIPTTSEGFVELSQTKNQPTKSQIPNTESPSSNADFFGFMDNSNTKSQIPNTESSSFSAESNGYDKREVDAKMTNLDNKIYKLEQRIELLEKKLDVNQPTNNTGVMGW